MGAVGCTTTGAVGVTIGAAANSAAFCFSKRSFKAIVINFKRICSFVSVRLYALFPSLSLIPSKNLI